MKTFSIDKETDNIIVHDTKAEAAAEPNAECFATKEELAKLAASWKASRLVRIWNGLPGEVPVTRFKDAKYGILRIWKAVQRLGEAVEPARTPRVAPQSRATAPTNAKADKKATRAKRTPTARDNATTPRDGSKKALVLGLLGKPSGATLAALMEATGWQAHSVRGFLSGSLTKKGTPVASEKRDGVRVYSLKA